MAVTLPKKPTIVTKEIQIDDMALESGADIVSNELNLIFNQPKLIEISMIKIENFYDALGLLNFKKEKLKESETLSREDIDSRSNFQWINSILKSNKEKINNLTLLFLILLKNYEIVIDTKNELFIFTNRDNPKNIVKISSLNFDIFKKYINIIFYIEKNNKSQKYNPANSFAEKIIEKIEKGLKERARLKQNAQKEKVSITSLISSLAEILKLPLEEVYRRTTLCQLYVQINRHKRHESSNNALEAMMHGATKIEVTDWYGDLE